MLFRWLSRSRKVQAPVKGGGSLVRPTLEGLEDRNLPSTFYVWQFGGNDTLGAGTQASPFQSMQRAINAANSGDEIRVAGGGYTYSPAQDVLPGSNFSLSQNLGSTAVAVVFNKSLTIRGGFNPVGANGWSAPDANAPSIIDGQGTYRGVWVTTTSSAGAALSLDGFTIQNGVGQSIPLRAEASPASAVNGYGGGLLSEASFLAVNQVTFLNNRAFGVSNTAPGASGGVGAGGGLAVFSAPGTVSVTNSTFTSNTATGGNGDLVGGYGQAGGLYASASNVMASNLTFNGNVARGGDAAGAGTPGDNPFLHSDGQGGAIDITTNPGGVVLSKITATGNSAFGGNAPNGLGGYGLGGGIVTEKGLAPVTIVDSTITSNLAQGGDGVTTGGSVGGGGGIDTNNGDVVIDRTIVQGNTAQGGKGSPVKAGANGGGIYAVNTTRTTPFNLFIRNSLVTANTAAFGGGTSEATGGGGGGLAVFGIDAAALQSTFADNVLANVAQNAQGQAILVNSSPTSASTLAFSYNIVANEINSLTGTAAAVDVFPGSSASYTTNLFANNSRNDNSDGQPNPGGAFSGQGTNLSAASAGFLSAGPPNFNYGLAANSPALHAAVGSTDPVDLFNNPRGVPPDLGAVETGATTTLLSSSANPARAGQTITLTATVLSGTGSPTGTVTFLAGTSSLGTMTLVNGSAALPISLPVGSTSLTAVYGGDANFKGSTSATLVQQVSPAGTAQRASVFDPNTGLWYLHDSNSSGAPTIAPFAFGLPGWQAVVGDWSGSGHTGIGVFDPNTATWYLRNSDSPGAPDFTPFQFGAPGWLPVVGNWTGSGRTSIGIFDPTTATFYLRNELSAGAADAGVLAYGVPGWLPLAGDWTGTGHSGIGVFDPGTATFHLRTETSAGAADAGEFAFGLPRWTPVVGDWDGNGTVTIGVFDPTMATFYLRNENSAGAPDAGQFAYGGTITPILPIQVTLGSVLDLPPTFTQGWTPLAVSLVTGPLTPASRRLGALD
jgi:hypothetical protein